MAWPGERAAYGGPTGPTGAPRATASGPAMFVRYAFPPNSHGYCGPADTGEFFEYGVTGAIDPGFRQLARAFEGAWPYLELIAGATGIADPLDPRVVEAYWVGNSLLDRVGASHLGTSMEDRFRHRTGPRFGRLAEGVVAGGLPHHSFHVFCIYPWTGLLGDDRRAEQALLVLDRCRIRWGRVTALLGDQVVVESRALTWDGHTLALGAPAPESVVRAVAGAGMLPGVAVGDWVALHWEWVCDILDGRGLRALQHYTDVHLSVVNAGTGPSGAALALG